MISLHSIWMILCQTVSDVLQLLQKAPLVFHLARVHSLRKGKNFIVISFEPAKLSSRNVLLFIVQNRNSNKCKTIIFSFTNYNFLWKYWLFYYCSFFLVLRYTYLLRIICMISFNLTPSYNHPYLDWHPVGLMTWCLICNSQQIVHCRSMSNPETSLTKITKITKEPPKLITIHFFTYLYTALQCLLEEGSRIFSPFLQYE